MAVANLWKKGGGRGEVVVVVGEAEVRMVGG